MPTNRDDVRSRGKIGSLRSSINMTLTRKSMPPLTGQVFYARAQIDAYDKRYIRSLHGNLSA
jgi:hypothetical protein